MKIVNIFKAECAHWRWALFTISVLPPIYSYIDFMVISDEVFLGMMAISSVLVAIAFVDFRK